MVDCGSLSVRASSFLGCVSLGDGGVMPGPPLPILVFAFQRGGDHRKL